MDHEFGGAYLAILTCCPAPRFAPARLHSRFIRRWPVQPRDRDVVQPQVDAQVGAVMDDVIQHESAQHGQARHREHRRATAQE